MSSAPVPPEIQPLTRVVDIPSRRRIAPRSAARRPGHAGLLALMAMIGFAGGVAVLDRSAAVPGSAELSRATYTLCMNRNGPDCVIDGDTLRHGGLPVRIADIDAPEVFSHQCDAERALGEAAARRLLELVNAGPFEMRPWDHRDEDVYGRKLRVLMRDGVSLGQVLVEEGLAREWDGARRGWCG